jgi:hypothetical protein
MTYVSSAMKAGQRQEPNIAAQQFWPEKGPEKGHKGQRDGKNSYGKTHFGGRR